MKTTFSGSVLWSVCPGVGRVSVTHGRLDRLSIAQGKGRVGAGEFDFERSGPARLEFTVADSALDPGPNATILRVDSECGSFSVFLRDLAASAPILVPDFRAALTRPDDARSFEEIAAACTAGKLAGIDRMEKEPEETLAHAASLGCTMWLPALLGLGRDARLFQVDIDRTAGYWGTLRASFHGYPVFPHYPHQPDDAPFEFAFVLGRGMGCQAEFTRRLDDGVLPILHGTGVDGEITYDITAFVTLERRLLADGPLRGTPAMFGAGLAAGFDFRPDEFEHFERERAAGAPDELEVDNQTVLLLRAVATNHAAVPRYAFLKSPFLTGNRRGSTIRERYDPEAGLLLVMDDDHAALASRLNGRPMPLNELSILLPPGGTAAFDLTMPHSPCHRARVEAMAKLDFNQRLEDCRAHWRRKLATVPTLSLPERRIEEQVKAGLFHIDMLMYGRADEPSLSVPVGMHYPPIGSESLPMIFFFDPIGWHDVARRGLTFFLERQRDDGFIQVYAHYLIETSGVVFGLAEHYRYTRDDAWVRAIRPRLLKACDYLIRWRRRNCRAELRGKGFGLLDGAVADEKDPTPYFYNSGYACAGLRGAAEMLRAIDPDAASALAAEAEQFRNDIRAELAESMANSPLIPLADGSWRPVPPPWAGHPGPLMLFATPRTAYTHHSFTTQDSVVGPIWLIFQGILDPSEQVADQLMHTHHELMTVHNVAFCQQYYSRHDYAHLLRREPNSFLSDYYHSLSTVDREVYGFWEHYCMNTAGAYKTHEQGWFLMQTRWMLYLEDGDTLRLLPGVPREWLQDGKRIVFSGMKSHFGPLAVSVESKVSEETIWAHLECRSDRRPHRIELRLPHPQRRTARSAAGGRYDAAIESVIIEGFTGEAAVTLSF